MRIDFYHKRDIMLFYLCVLHSLSDKHIQSLKNSLFIFFFQLHYFVGPIKDCKDVLGRGNCMIRESYCKMDRYRVFMKNNCYKTCKYCTGETWTRAYAENIQRIRRAYAGTILLINVNIREGLPRRI